MKKEEINESKLEEGNNQDVNESASIKQESDQRIINYSADNYWFIEGAGFTNQIRNNEFKKTTWFGEGIDWAFQIQNDKSSTISDWVFKKIENGKYSCIMFNNMTAKLASSGDFAFHSGISNDTELNNRPQIHIASNGNLGFGIVAKPNVNFYFYGTTEFQDRITFNGQNNFFGTNMFYDNVEFKPKSGTNTGSLAVSAAGGKPEINAKYNADLVLKANDKSIVELNRDGYMIVYNNGIVPSNLNISNANKERFSLFVLGGMLSEDYVIAPQSMWSTRSLSDEYKLMSLGDLEKYIQNNRSLPDMPTAQQVNEEGYNLHEMNVKLLEKVEQLSLYAVQLNKELELLKTKVEKLESK